MGLHSQPIACNEVLRYIVRVLNFVIFCNVPVKADYILNTNPCADMSNDSIDCVFRRDTAVFSLFDFVHV